MGKTVSNQEIEDAIRNSGLTEAEVRAKLQAAGYDPNLADPFFKSGGRGGAAGGTAPDAFVKALQAVGVLHGEAEGLARGDQDRSIRADDSTQVLPGLHVFGSELFRRRASEFDPTTSGPVDPSYRLGVGDEIQIVLTGEVEAVYNIEVRRDGTIILPSMGQVAIAGLTMDAARTALSHEASRVYSGLNNGKTHLDLTIARLRSNLVYVIGEVRAPGAYEVNSLSTVLSALARAGGPTDVGSYRRIEVRRAGRVVSLLDLYDYLLAGNSQKDVRLEQGDIVFVPLATKQVGIKGEVRRQGVFELTDGDGFDQLLNYAGGLRSTAALKRLTIDRVLLPQQRLPAVDRKFIDIQLDGDIKRAQATILFDHDLVTIYSVGDLRRNSYNVTGEVVSPGTFELTPGVTVREAVQKADGLLPWGIASQIKVQRLDQARGVRTEIPVDLSVPSQASLAVAEYDVIVVLDERRTVPHGKVSITGAINSPTSTEFVEGQSLIDLIDAAGGFREEAQYLEVARLQRSQNISDTASIVIRFDVQHQMLVDTLAARRFTLLRGDQVFVRGAPGFRALQTVSVVGLFAHPGVYPIRSDTETVRSLIRRAGGVLPNADPRSFRLIRLGRAVPVVLEQVMKGDPLQDITLYVGDQIRVLPALNVVLVSGAVERQVAVPYEPSLTIEDYVLAAGGRAPGAKRDVVVEYASGRVSRSKRVALLFRYEPKIESGATIFVLSNPEDSGAKLKDALAAAWQVTATVMSLLIAYIAVRK